jgi:2-dehydro-3-deoxyphosphogluconate aldolase/(4S)-4-hydroxy-2-oxoglutarate aldolase
MVYFIELSMQIHTVYKQLEKLKVFPVITIEKVEQAIPLADTLQEGGLPVIEITFRTEAAAGVIRKLRQERPDMLVGAGTILTSDQLKKAKDCGAAYGVAPGFNRKIVEETLRLDFPFSPGVMTPTDIEAALDLGIHVLKFFPAEPSGGVKTLSAIAAPYLHTGVRFIAMGGIHLNNFQEYLKTDAVLAVGGSWIAKHDRIAAGDWKTIKQNCVEIRRILDGSD